MEINVAQLLKVPIGAARNCEVDESVDVTGDGHSRLVKGKVRLLRTQRGILVRGGLHTELELICGRCLSVFDYPVALNIDEEYISTVDVVGGALLPSSDEPGAFTIDEHHVIDLTEAARQYVLLAIPIKPLCRKGCAGLCQGCGHNLSQGPCDCPGQKIDPRWSELSKLLE